MNPHNKNLIFFIVKTRLYPNHHAFSRVDKLLQMIYTSPEKEQPQISCARNDKCAFGFWAEKCREMIIDIYIYVLRIKRRVSPNDAKPWGVT